jgi:penicillin amidase
MNGGGQGASWRMVVELGSTVRAWGTYPGGQSGNPASVRYDDRLPLWLKGELAELRFPRRPEELQPRSSLRLVAER